MRFLPTLDGTKDHLLSKRLVVAESIKQHRNQCATIEQLRRQLNKAKDDNRRLGFQLNRDGARVKAVCEPALSAPFSCTHRPALTELAGLHSSVVPSPDSSTDPHRSSSSRLNGLADPTDEYQKSLKTTDTDLVLHSGLD